jgi:hypothetical protein
VSGRYDGLFQSNTASYVHELKETKGKISHSGSLLTKIQTSDLPDKEQAI